MKISERLVILFGESNQRLVNAYKQVKYCVNDIIGGLDNTIQDYNESDKAYKDAEAALKDNSKLHETIYHAAFFEDTRYFDGGGQTGCKKFIEDLRFIGADKMHKIVDWMLAYRGSDFVHNGWNLKAFEAKYSK